jgi:hypothetical protein
MAIATHHLISQVYTSVNCTGDEASLTECTVSTHEGITSTCDPANAVGISCLNVQGLPQDPASVAEREYFNSKAEGHVKQWRENSKSRAQAVQDEWFSATNTELPDAAPVDCAILPGVPMPFTQTMVDEACVFP